jgi:hypothetical protein
VIFASYDQFRSRVIALIDGDDVSQASFSVNTADIFIGFGENRVYRDLRASSMVTALNLAPVSTVYTLPSRLVELKELYFSGEQPVEIVTLDKLRKLQADAAYGGSTVYAAQNGDKLEFWPSATANVLGSYYGRPTNDMEAETDWPLQTTVNRYPECFIYAALCESAPFMGDDSRLPMWEAKYSIAVRNAHASEQSRVWGGSPLRVRAR